MRKLVLFIMLFQISLLLFGAEYKILLSWDEFEGECNGFLSGSIGKNVGFVNGVRAEKTLNNKLISVGEGRSSEAKQVFKINADDGYFTFWIKDKFADDDMNTDPNLITQSKPSISIYKGNNLLKIINIPVGQGLACKVFTLDASNGEVDREIKYFPKSRIIVGKIVNAVDGKSLSNTNVSIVNYMKETQNFQTDESGIFIFNVDIGKYTINISKDGFIGNSLPVIMGADEMPREIICALSPEIKEFRIVLTWGSRPRDLDAHLSGPNPDGGDFHIWYRNKMLIGGKDFLDKDDTNSYGPETITIYKPAKGNYKYSVFDYSNKNKKNSKKLSLSNAIVQVYNNNKLLATFEIPQNFKGNCWHVFSIDETHEIIPINRVNFEKNEQNIH